MKRLHRPFLLILVPLLALPQIALSANATPTPGFDRTEQRADCDHYDPLRQPFFGDLHVHTRFSLDTVAFDTRNGPREAYRFAQGEPVGIGPVDANGEPRFLARLSRPLDFAAVTDHAELLGETGICTTPGSAGYNAPECRLLRKEFPGLNSKQANLSWQAVGFGSPSVAPHMPMCSTPGVDCTSQASVQWREIQQAAESAYDRTSACSFTSFVAFEWTATPLGDNLHRNVIFRNERVTPLPISMQDTNGAEPTRLWNMLDEQCLAGDQGCDVLAIPHNPNLSQGLMFGDPATPEEAAQRARMEPLVEMIQHKGASECRLGVGTSDEQCDFELLAIKNLSPAPTVPGSAWSERAFVRNVLKDGLSLSPRFGTNPFKLGFVGSTDTHFGTPGHVSEQTHIGHHHTQQDQRQQMLEEIDQNPGGLAVVWAEENSRDALFSALRRRETYATSGTRPILRVFGGWEFPAGMEHSPAFSRFGYRYGVPMGSDLRQRQAENSAPQFALAAMQDAQGNLLQRVQIIKGWVDEGGNTHEQVFDVAGDADNGAWVDEASCQPTGSGFSELRTTWQDPDFDAKQPAFYYARLLENPSCRWSTRMCLDAGVSPFSEQCNEQAASAGEGYDACCRSEVQPVIQERAWSSPIWYTPGDE